MTGPNETSVSICLVNYKAKDYLAQCLKSIFDHPSATPFEIILVENAPQDGSVELVHSHFPDVRILVNAHNEGFAKAMNQALRVSKGNYVLWLNIDTIVFPQAIDALVHFLQQHPDAGIVGPRVLNSDGTVQKQCHRSFPTPWVAFSYLSGLSRRFPHRPLFARYLLTYLDDTKVMEVDAVSGAALMMRREIIEQIGYIDESYFLYGDDLDYCYRTKKSGWKIYYVPDSEILHFGGKASSHRSSRSIVDWHRSMWIYYKKHLGRPLFFLISWMLWMAIYGRMTVNLLTNHLRREKFAGSRKP